LKDLSTTLPPIACQTFCHFNKKKPFLLYNVILGGALHPQGNDLQIKGAPWERAFNYIWGLLAPREFTWHKTQVPMDIMKTGYESMLLDHEILNDTSNKFAKILMKCY
jgi:hypothetical protein